MLTPRFWRIYHVYYQGYEHFNDIFRLRSCHIQIKTMYLEHKHNFLARSRLFCNLQTTTLLRAFIPVGSRRNLLIIVLHDIVRRDLADLTAVSSTSQNCNGNAIPFYHISHYSAPPSSNSPCTSDIITSLDLVFLYTSDCLSKHLLPVFYHHPPSHPVFPSFTLQFFLLKDTSLSLLFS